MKQTFFREPKYSKNYLVKNPRNTYEEYVNAFAFSEMIKGHNKTPNKEALQKQAQDRWKEVKIKDKNVIQNHIFELLHTPIQPSPFPFISQQKPVEESSRLPLIPLDILSEPYNNIQFRSNAMV